MISQAKSPKLAKIYFYICKIYDEDVKYHYQRFNNNNKPKLTDQKIMTIYLYVINEELRSKIKQTHRFTADYLGSWFPNRRQELLLDKELVV